MSRPVPLRVLCLAGPTGAGKTALAIRLAHRLDGEIVNADSRQVYRDFPVITAQPDEEERACAPHHLYGFLEMRAHMDVQRWLDLALAAAHDIASRGRLPILVGGTGMYFHRLLHGLADVPAVEKNLHEQLEERAGKEGAPALHAELAALDPELALRLHPNDRQRIVRGLEVALGTGHPLSWWQKNAHVPPACEGVLLVVDTKLKELEPRLAGRIESMIAKGALEEGRRALALCPDEGAPGWSGIGCREVGAYLLGRIGLEEARGLWLKNTRAYAKRQITWFRGRSEAVWIGADDLEMALAAHRNFVSPGVPPSRR